MIFDVYDFFYNFLQFVMIFVGLLWFLTCDLIRDRSISHVKIKSIKQEKKSYEHLKSENFAAKLHYVWQDT